LDIQWIKGNTIYDFRAGMKLTVVITDKDDNDLDVQYIVDGLYKEMFKAKNKDKVALCHKLGTVSTGPLAEKQHVASFMLGYHFKKLIDVNKLKIVVEGPEPVSAEEFDMIVLDRMAVVETDSLNRLKEQFDLIKKVADIAGLYDEEKS